MDYRREDSRDDTMGGMLISLDGDGGRDELGIDVALWMPVRLSDVWCPHHMQN